MLSKEMIIRKMPYFIQNLVITVFNVYQYRLRHGGAYQKFRSYYELADYMNENEIVLEIRKRKNEFLTYAKNKSKWYKNYQFDTFNEIPILEKKDIINYLDDIKTVNESNAIVSLTGGTTGASMKVLYTKQDMQERFAILDHFRAQHGYRLGKKTAWFSGKNLITERDLLKGRCSHYDFVNKIRFYSTFLINEKNFDIYWNSLNKFKPDFIVGFPSSVYEICLIAKQRNLKYSGNIKVFFPTAETVLPIHRLIINEVLGCKLVDQYASSEGAPFILECNYGNLHIHPLTGIFEVVDSNLQPIDSGEILITSFSTHGTPLIRYRIGDSITLAKGEQCKCGSFFPMVKSIDGRMADYILSPEYGRVNLGNISNSTKDIVGIICFQLIQYELEQVTLNLVVNSKFTSSQEKKFVSALRERIGYTINLNINYLHEIPKEKSGKFRIVKNMIGKQKNG